MIQSFPVETQIRAGFRRRYTPQPVKEIKRLYWKIGDVAKILDVKTSAVRFYEKRFNLHPERYGEREVRLYTQKEIDRLKAIAELSRYFKLEGVDLVLKNGVDPAEALQIVKFVLGIRDGK